MDGTELVRCGACGAQNRVPREKLAEGRQPVCGQCKALLVIGGRPVTVTDATFSAEVERSPVPVLIDCWAPWCGPCRMVAPALDALAAELVGRLRVAKVNVDDNPGVSARFGVQSIPTLLLLKDGRLVDRMVGAQSKSEIARWVQRVLQ